MCAAGVVTPSFQTSQPHGMAQVLSNGGQEGVHGALPLTRVETLLICWCLQRRETIQEKATCRCGTSSPGGWSDQSRRSWLAWIGRSPRERSAVRRWFSSPGPPALPPSRCREPKNATVSGGLPQPVTHPTIARQANHQVDGRPILNGKPHVGTAKAPLGNDRIPQQAIETTECWHRHVWLRRWPLDQKSNDARGGSDLE